MFYKIEIFTAGHGFRFLIEPSVIKILILQVLRPVREAAHLVILNLLNREDDVKLEVRIADFEYLKIYLTGFIVFEIEHSHV